MLPSSSWAPLFSLLSSLFSIFHWGTFYPDQSLWGENVEPEEEEKSFPISLHFLFLNEGDDVETFAIPFWFVVFWRQLPSPSHGIVKVQQNEDKCILCSLFLFYSIHSLCLCVGEGLDSYSGGKFLLNSAHNSITVKQQQDIDFICRHFTN